MDCFLRAEYFGLPNTASHFSRVDAKEEVKHFQFLSTIYANLDDFPRHTFHYDAMIVRLQFVGCDLFS